jgi:hypothetical protein
MGVCNGVCARCNAYKWLVFGLVLLGARLYYPAVDVWVVIGSLFVLKGLAGTIKPTCPHSEENSPGMASRASRSSRRPSRKRR